MSKNRNLFGWTSHAVDKKAHEEPHENGTRKKFDLTGAFLRRTNLSYANLEQAKLSKADFTDATFKGANFQNADLEGTILRGADLTDVRNLTMEQLARAIVDERTKLPTGFSLDALRDFAVK